MFGRSFAEKRILKAYFNVDGEKPYLEWFLLFFQLNVEEEHLRAFAFLRQCVDVSDIRFWCRVGVDLQLDCWRQFEADFVRREHNEDYR